LAFVRTLIHIGLPRTASTFLQRQVFPKIREVEFYGVDTCFYSEAFQRLLYEDDSLYTQPRRDQLIQTKSENILLSNELFCGQSFAMNATNRSRTAIRLKQVFPEAEIVLMLRNQLQLLESLYSIAVYGGYYKKPDEFLNFGNSGTRYNTFSENEHAEAYLFTPLVDLYKEKFKRVHVFLFEDFSANPDQFVQNMASELNIELNSPIVHTKKENKSLGQRQISYFRKVNRAKSLLEWSSLGKSIYRQKLWFGEHVIQGKKRFQFSRDLAERIKAYYRNDNIRLLNSLKDLENSPNYKRYYQF